MEIMLTEFFRPQLDALDFDGKWFQQDGVICHTAHDTIHYCKRSSMSRWFSETDQSITLLVRVI